MDRPITTIHTVATRRFRTVLSVPQQPSPLLRPSGECFDFEWEKR
ncbi:hypothetical protein ACIBO5_08200 [Nonomuraea angiospora]|nr:hypothetical protein [Nonomuraea angiospora]MDX3102078.1 hypothetical protein [Nonomuraea angiospora]